MKHTTDFEAFTMSELMAGGLTIDSVVYAAMRIQDDYNAPYDRAQSHIKHLRADLGAVHRVDAMTGTPSAGLHQFLGSKAAKISQEIGAISSHEPSHISEGVTVGLGLPVAVAAGILVGKAVSVTRRFLHDGDMRFEEALQAMQEPFNADQPDTKPIEVEAA